MKSNVARYVLNGMTRHIDLSSRLSIVMIRAWRRTWSYRLTHPYHRQFDWLALPHNVQVAPAEAVAGAYYYLPIPPLKRSFLSRSSLP